MLILEVVAALSCTYASQLAVAFGWSCVSSALSVHLDHIGRLSIFCAQAHSAMLHHMDHEEFHL